jgi:DNA-binding IclR family transcriptional regulator
LAKADATGTQSLDRALALLRVVAGRAGRGLRLADAVAQSGLAKPTAHRLLQALERQGFVAQDAGSKLYHLGPEAFVIGTLANERFGIHRAALPCLTRLAAASQDTSFLTVRRDGHGVCLHREEGGFPIRSHVLKAGDRHPLGVGAGSLAILAALPPAEAAAVLVQVTPELEARYPGFSPALVNAQVETTRRSGFAFNPGQLTAGSWAVGVAVLNADGGCEGALSIAAIESRVAAPRRDQLVALLRNEALQLSANLQRPAGASGFARPHRQAAT